VENIRANAKKVAKKQEKNARKLATIIPAKKVVRRKLKNARRVVRNVKRVVRNLSRNVRKLVMIILVKKVVRKPKRSAQKLVKMVNLDLHHLRGRGHQGRTLYMKILEAAPLLEKTL
jgi:F0F1-type ATP synthase membrane subunit b/b'